ncbi:hypothetical protein AFCA_010907 [Aspergillus flavus]|nr:hypothetical protein AFCA_010907 [Aspergillus flavus]
MPLPVHPPPRSPLDRHRQLAPSASVRVTPLCLGAMNFGDAWKDSLGECPKETAFTTLDYSSVKEAISSTPPTTTRTKNPRNGLGNRLPRDKIVINSSWPASSRAATKP